MSNKHNLEYDKLVEEHRKVLGDMQFSILNLKKNTKRLTDLRSEMENARYKLAIERLKNMNTDLDNKTKMFEETKSNKETSGLKDKSNQN